MGWSLGGILGTVAKAVGNTGEEWAKRGIIEDAKIRDDERTFARQKEMVDYNDQVAATRAERTAELAEKADFKKRDKDAATVSALEWSATKDPDGPKLKAGTVAFHDWMSSQLSASGEEGLAKNQAAMSNLLRDDERSERQLQGTLANAGATRAQAAASLAATREDRAAQLDLKREELKGKQDKDHRADMANLGTLQRKDKATGEDIKDPSGYPVLRKVDSTLETTYGMADRADRVDAMAQISATARNYYAQQLSTKAPVSWDVALQKSAAEWATKNPPPEPKTKK